MSDAVVTVEARLALAEAELMALRAQVRAMESRMPRMALSSRFLSGVALVAALAVVGVGLASSGEAQLRAQAPTRGTRLKAPVTIVDSRNRPILVVADDSTYGRGAMALDGFGKPVAALGLNQLGGRGVAVFNAAGAETAGLSADALTISTGSGAEVVAVESLDGGGVIMLSKANSPQNAILTGGFSGLGPGLSLFGGDRKSNLSASELLMEHPLFPEQGKARMYIQDANGHVEVSGPMGENSLDPQ